jgi:hypothetical protein
VGSRCRLGGEAADGVAASLESPSIEALEEDTPAQAASVPLQPREAAASRTPSITSAREDQVRVRP